MNLPKNVGFFFNPFTLIPVLWVTALPFLSVELNAQRVGGQMGGGASTLFNGDTVSSLAGGIVNLEINNSGQDLEIVQIPIDPLTGNADGPPSFAFTPSGTGEVRLSPNSLTLKSAVGVALNGTVPVNDIPTYYPTAWGALEDFSLRDGILFFPEESGLNGQAIQFDITMDVTVSMSLNVGTSANTDASASATYRIVNVRYEGDVDGPVSDFEGSVKRTIRLGEASRTEDGEGNFNGTKSVTVKGGRGILGPASLQDIEEYNSFGFMFSLDTNVFGSGPGGATFNASIQVNLSNFRITNVRFQETQIPIDLETLTSLSQSGFDWLGNGEPPDPLEIEGHHWINPQGGVFNVPSNWFDENDNGQEDDIPGPSDRAVFAIPSAYSVTLAQDQFADKLILAGDDSIVTFNPNGHLLEPFDTYIGYIGGDAPRLRVTHTEFYNRNDLILGENGSTGHLEISDPIGLTTKDLVVKGASSSVTVRGSAVNDSFVEITDSLDLLEGSMLVRGESEGPFTYHAMVSIASLFEEGLNHLNAGPGTNIVVDQGGTILFTDAFMTIGEAPGNAELQTGPVAQLTIDGGTLVNDDENNPFNRSSVSTISGFFLTGGSAPGTVQVTNGGYFGTGLPTDDQFTDNSFTVSLGLYSPAELLVDGFSTEFPELRSTVEAHTLTLNEGAIIQEEPPLATMTVQKGAYAHTQILKMFGDRSGVYVGDFLESTPSTLEIDQTLEMANGRLEAFGGGQVSFLYEMNIETAGNSQILVTNGGSISGPLEPRSDEFSVIKFQTSEEVTHEVLRVSGVDSNNRSSFFEYNGSGPGISFSGDSAGKTALASIADGAYLTSASDLILGDIGNGMLVISGEAQPSGKRSKVTAATLFVGTENRGRGILEILDGGLLEADGVRIADGGIVRVGPSQSETRSELYCSGFLDVGSDLDFLDDTGIHPALLTLTEADLFALEQLVIREHGRVEGTGTITTASVVNDGYLAPGLSPGTLEIVGDYNQGETGTLEMEIFGSEPGDQDLLIVHGDVALRGTLLLVFGNQVPSINDEYPLMDISGDYSEQNVKMKILGLQPGFQSRFEVIDGKLTLIAESDALAITVDDFIQVLKPQISSSGAVRLQFYGVVGANYFFETSPDLETWEILSSVVGDDNLIELTTEASNSNRRFYRIRQVIE